VRLRRRHAARRGDHGFVERHKYNREFLLVSSLRTRRPDFARAPRVPDPARDARVAAFEWVRCSRRRSSRRRNGGDAWRHAQLGASQYRVFVLAELVRRSHWASRSRNPARPDCWPAGSARSRRVIHSGAGRTLCCTVLNDRDDHEQRRGCLMFRSRWRSRRTAASLLALRSLRDGRSVGRIHDSIGYQTNLMVYGPVAIAGRTT